MCRGIDHGVDSNGKAKRCPCDTSEARQLRRMKNRATERNLERVKPEFKAQTLSLPKTEGVASISEVKSAVKTVQGLITAQEELSAMMPVPSHMYKIDVNGETLRGDKFDLLQKIIVDQEIAIVKVGFEINRLIDKKVGITDSDIYEKYKDATLIDIKDYEIASKEYSDALNSVRILIPSKALIMSEPEHQIILAQDYYSNDAQKLQKFEDTVQKYRSYKAHIEETRKRLEEFIDYGDYEVQGLIKKRLDTTKEILAEIRSIGGNVIIRDDGSQQTKVKIIQEVAKLYPTDWIKNANDKGIPPIVKQAPQRAHYSAHALQKVDNSENVIIEVVKPADWTPNPRNSLEYGYIEINPQTGKYKDGDTEKTALHVATGENKSWAVPIYEHFNAIMDKSRFTKSGELRPRGRGWKEEEFDFTVKDDKTGMDTIETKKIWVKPAIQKSARTFNSPEITISDRKTPYHESSGYKVGVHEFAHYMEDKGSDFISQTEEQFLKRRTTDSDGKREPLLKIIDLEEGSKYKAEEVVRADGFPNAYMGKEYEDKYREVLSMGMESIFAGSNGGLIGLGKYKSDSDMKNFIIGLLASGK